MESTFIGLWVFGWEKLPKKIHLACAWLVAFASNLSAFWILIANSFMQNPVGYTIENGRAVMTSFWALIANPNLPYQFFHIFFAGLVTAGFVVLGFSAWHLLRKKENTEFFQTSFKLAALFALVGIILVGVMGDAHGKYLFKAQPMKISAAEAIWEDEKPADFILIANVNEKDETNEFEIRIPKVLSFLLYNNFTGGVKGLKTLQAEAVSQYGPGDYIPPVTLTFWSFRVMVGVGLLMALLALLAFLKPRLKFLDKSRVFLRILPFAMVLPYIGTTSGWILTEEARQPWIVYGLQKVSEAVSPNITVGGVLFSLILFFVLLGALVGVTGWLIIKSGLAEPQIEKSSR
jgi:cytochrome d ubiquinol oxidase subunit I